MASDKDFNLEEIRDRYWKGETTLEEEAWLKANEKAHPLFHYVHQKKQERSNLTLEQLMARVPQAKNDRKYAKRIRFNRWAARIAAGLLILAAATFLIKPGENPQEAQPLYAETYENPEKAYKEVKQALLLVSSKINKTTDRVQKEISKAEPYTEIFK